VIYIIKPTILPKIKLIVIIMVVLVNDADHHGLGNDLNAMQIILQPPLRLLSSHLYKDIYLLINNVLKDLTPNRKARNYIQSYINIKPFLSTTYDLSSFKEKFYPIKPGFLLPLYVN
jgi:hypothetical protein